MSTQYSTCSRGCHSGDSPSSTAGTGSCDQTLSSSWIMPPPVSRFYSGATVSVIVASMRSPGGTVTRPCAAGSAMWIALLTWLTGSTQK